MWVAVYTLYQMDGCVKYKLREHSVCARQVVWNVCVWVLVNVVWDVWCEVSGHAVGGDMGDVC